MPSMDMFKFELHVEGFGGFFMDSFPTPLTHFISSYFTFPNLPPNFPHPSPWLWGLLTCAL